MTSSEDRWVYPAEGEDPRAIDAERTDEDAPDRDADRQVSHDQDVERDQRLSSDKPGVDVSEREVAAEDDEDDEDDQDDQDDREIGRPRTT